MPSTFERVAETIAATCGVPAKDIAPETHLVDDLGLDSLDLADLAFELDRAFGINVPIERWTEEIDKGGASSDAYLVVSSLCAHIDRLVAAKPT